MNAITIPALIIAADFIIASIILYRKYRQKCQEKDLLSADYEKTAVLLAESQLTAKKSAGLCNSLTSRIETLESEADCLKAERQQKSAENEKISAELSETRQRLDLHKMKMVDMVKHLVALQRTIMTDTGQIKSMFGDFFVLYKPWETVGGDFYKFIRKGGHTLVACGNCGHSGINGFVKGLLNIVFLQEIVEKGDITKMEAGQVLDALRSKYAHIAGKNQQYRTDDDIPVNFSVVIINEKQRLLSYAGAYGSMCLLRKSYPGTSRKENDLHEFRGDRMNFAVSFGRRKNYTTENIELEKDDKIYLKTDGFANQRGGANNARFGDPYLRQLMIKHANEPMLDQKRAFEDEFNNWKGENSKGNDIMVIGLALKVKSNG